MSSATKVTLRRLEGPFPANTTEATRILTGCGVGALAAKRCCERALEEDAYVDLAVVADSLADDLQAAGFDIAYAGAAAENP